MLTLGLELAVNNTDVYELTETGLRLARRSSSTVDLEERASHPLHIKAPPFLEIEAQWSSLPIQSGEGNNILGENGQLQMKHKNIAIPIVEAASETLGYYGAILLEKGDSIQFPNPIFPLFRMNIGENYVSEFINSKEGGGFYLEYHKDQPHFHMPIKGSGYYILAKWNEDTTKLQITAFKIPDGKAVYTKKGAIHCDAALVGNLIVGYSTSEAFSTVLLRSEEKQFVDVIFESAHFLPLII